MQNGIMSGDGAEAKMNKPMLRALSEIILPPGSTSADLQAAIDGAASGDAIVISGDMPFTGAVTVAAGKEITIQSDTGNNWALTQAISDLRHFNVTGSLTLQSVTLDGVNSGGGIQVNQDASAVLNDGAIIKNCMSSGHGGGVNANGGALIIDGGNIINNTSAGSGGGIYSTGVNSSVQLLSGAIDSNNATGAGGGACVRSMSMRGGSISHNYTDGGSGGGMFILESLEMTGGEISYNEVRPIPDQRTASGGGLYCSGTLSAPATISGGKIHHNKVGVTDNGSRGGGVCVFRGVKFLMNGGEIYENEAAWGAGMFFDAYMQYGVPEENTVITGNAFIHDNQGSQGGGICFYNDVPGNPDIGILGMAPQISGNVRITGNSALYGSGIMFYPYLGSYTPTQLMINATISDNVEISGNKAANRGAGVLIQDDNRGRGVVAALTIKGNVTVLENEITTDTGIGGGIYLANSTFKMSDGTVSGNTANSGGGIYINNSGFSMESSIIDGNTAKNGSGGGMYLRGGGIAEVTNGCLIANNHAPNGDGGGIFAENAGDYGNLLTDESTVFSCNSAQAAYGPPENAGTLYPDIKFAGTSITDHPLNNFDINYTAGEPVEVEFNVIYNANGGVGSHVGPKIMPGGIDVVLSADETGISRTDHTLTAWNTKPDGSGTGYVQGDAITVDCNVTLYAQWVADESYIITYDCNGGRGHYIDHCRKFEISYTVLSTSQTGISSTGSVFTVWSTQPDGSGVSYASGEIISVSGDVTLYAQWRRFPEQKKLCRAPALKCRIAIEGQIIWVDNDNAGNTRPSSVEILLLRDGEVYKRANADSAGDGYFGFCCMPVQKNSSQKYIYRIDEAAVPGYTTTIEGYNVINTLAP